MYSILMELQVHLHLMHLTEMENSNSLGEIIYYDVALRYLEGSFYYDKNWMPDDQWNRLRMKIEAFLGRSLRPIEQVGFGM